MPLSPHLLIGLGNPGSEFEETRHNIGFRIIDAFVKEKNSIFTSKKKLKGDIADIHFNTRQMIVLKPTTFMNRSGESVLLTKTFFHIEDKHMLVVYDDADLPFGEIRFRSSGSSGGHRGMQSILERLATQGISRLRFGIGRPKSPDTPLEDWVLKKWTASEEEQIKKLIDDCLIQIEDIFKTN
ncbi:aminoacyl-tRNA hydrolase [Candidatus Uhrbacteria bacterium CG_4_9_14_3_um_filter_36_7]|uniref:Peptidyl-tRNA hydrolase n=1 Tax=Candidatus Uhrbacteria bacterium CG_4_9_14_3_um_filter_36_7 TaxID=1975033 RepID=A0A2M7XHP1_9BACT|nr:MAG: aminoacyl-tRNA hydrolase [Candidatus Uhrbacteria bacterium CG_4_9_14_3_um_filter_36_7]